MVRVTRFTITNDSLYVEHRINGTVALRHDIPVEHGMTGWAVFARYFKLRVTERSENGNVTLHDTRTNLEHAAVFTRPRMGVWQIDVETQENEDGLD